LIDALPHFVWTASGDGNVDYVSKQWEEYTGISGKECFGSGWSAFVHIDDEARTSESWQSSVRTGSSYHCEHRLRGKAGQYRWFISRAARIQESDGSMWWLGTSTDIQDQKDLQDRLRETEERYCALFDSMTEGFMLGAIVQDENKKPVDARFIAINPWLIRSGLVPRDSVGETWQRLPVGFDNKTFEILGGVAASGEPARFETTDQNLGRQYECQAYQPSPGQFAATFRDVTDQKRVQQALREAEERLALAIDATHFGLFDFNPQTGKLIWSEFAKRQFGLSPDAEVNYDVFLKGLHPDDRERVERLVQHALSPESGGEYVAEYRTIGIQDGKERWLSIGGRVFFDSDGRPVRFIGGGLDVTERKLLDSQVRELEKQKVESMALLASGIAHDFNNLLGGILGCAELALSQRSEGASADEELLRIKTAAIRGGEIVRQLMTYGGEEGSGFEPVDISSIADEILQLLKGSLPRHHILETDLAKDLPGVSANAAQIRQVVMNLVANASEAISKPKGVIRVATSQVAMKSNTTFSGSVVLPAGDYVKLEVTDSGDGVAPELLSKIFAPFFTTKRTGRGLGLAAVERIVRSHSGTINVVSKSSHGTRFEVLLPCIDHSARPLGGSSGSNSIDQTRSIAGTVLVVEDEDILRSAVSKMLRKRGLSVIEAVDGSNASDLLRNCKTDIGVVLLDMTLPKVSGPEVFAELRKIRPEVRVILTTAYTEEMTITAVSGERAWAFIRKPYQFNDLVKLISEALAQKQTC
jgi:PAS domain S-box-containing protein